MKRALALVWLGFLLAASTYITERVYHGLSFRTDLMALLPRDQQNPVAQAANDKAMNMLARRIIFMIGAPDRDDARNAASIMAAQLTTSAEISLLSADFAQDRLRQIGSLYFPYRAGLLNTADRQLLLDDKASEIVSRSLSRAFGTMGMINADMLHADPFLLLPDFFTTLPVPASRMTLDHGMLTAQDNDMTWIMLSGEIHHDPFALATQKDVASTTDMAVAAISHARPNLRILKLGAVFFAKAGADQAIEETSWIGIFSGFGTLLLIWLAFRGWRPLLLSLSSILCGILAAFAGSLLLFGELHVGALLFGTSLIGVAVDYSLQYCSEIFSIPPKKPDQKLRNVFTAITLGASTTVIGYLTFMLAPFPGLHQIAIFSVIGIIGAWLTVILWFPILDSAAPRDGGRMLIWAQKFLALWENPQSRRHCYTGLVLAVILAVAGLGRFHADDDIHHMQSLNPALLEAKQKISALTGKNEDSQFFIVQATDEENALRTEEKLAEYLQPLIREGALHGFQELAQYIPSIERQMENRQLVKEKLYQPLLRQQMHQLNLATSPLTPDDHQPPLTPDVALAQNGPLAFLSSLTIDSSPGKITQLVMLDGIQDSHRVAAAAQGLQRVYFVDPASDYSRLIGQYRQRALYLLAFSALLMMPLLVWRYGFAKGLWVMIPPSLAVLLAPMLCALIGNTFTFFDAMALVLVLSIGVDYAIFCAETSQQRKNVTMLAIALAACTALLSFGLLALSHVAAVRHFGITMLVGISISFMLAPMARLIKQK